MHITLHILRRHLAVLVMLFVTGVACYASGSGSPSLASADAMRSSKDFSIANILFGDFLSSSVSSAEDDARVRRAATVPLGIRYTEKHPLIIVGDWIFKPYSFINNEGMPDGFQVALIKEIFSKMHVPYEIRLMDWKKAKEAVQNGTAQLMIGIQKDDTISGAKYGKRILAEYKVGVMHPYTRTHIRSLKMLTENDTLTVNKDDYAAQKVMKFIADTIAKGGKSAHIRTQNPYIVYSELVDGTAEYYIWGKMALRSLKERYDVNNIMDVDDIDVPAGCFMFYSTDQQLLDELDVQFDRLVASGRYDVIHDKWLSDNGDYVEDNTFLHIVIVVFILILIVVFVFIIILSQRGVSTSSLKKEFNSITKTGLDLSKCQLLAMKVSNQWVYNISGSYLPSKGVHISTFEDKYIHPDDITIVTGARSSVDNGRTNMPELRYRMRPFGADENDWRNMVVSAYVKTTKRGKPTYIYLVMRDETDSLIESQKLDKVINELGSVTDSIDAGIIYYNQSGEYISCNKHLRKMFSQVTHTDPVQVIKSINLNNLPILNGIIVEKGINVNYCTMLVLPELGLNLHVEVTLRSIIDRDGVARGYYLSISDCSNELKLRKELKAVNQRLQTNSLDINRYKRELNYMLSNNNMRTFRWLKGNDYIEISKNLLNFEIHISLKEYKRRITGEKRTPLDIFFDNPEQSIPEAATVVQRYSRTLDNGAKDDHWYEVYYLPDYDNEGEYIGIFGVFCDITEQILTEQHLKEETDKANDSGRQKTVFLANMTHELRTPLNAINGFAEVLAMSSTPEEKQMYVDIMAHSCTMLISLVDNILQMSIIDTEGIKLHPKPVDFAVLFQKSVTEMQRFISAPGVRLEIESPYPHLNLNIDYERVMQVVEAFVNNASKYTSQGFIRVGYSCTEHDLTIYCKDTGCGIPDDQLDRIFERFVKLNDFVEGTGLGLTVCKAIAKALGGSIKVSSVVGGGSEFVLTIKI